MKKTKMEKGITLIALIITIVVLLILAVVTIQAIEKSEIIGQAKNAGSTYTVAQEKEQLTLAASEWMLAENMPNNTKTFKQTALDSLPSDATITGAEGGPLTITFKTGNSYTLAADGTIVSSGNNGGGSVNAPGTSLYDLYESGELQLGDYIEYTPSTSAAPYTISRTLSGTNNDQSVAKDTLRWRVLGTDENNNLLLISATPTYSGFRILGHVGYNNYEDILNNTCNALYSNEGLGITARNVTMDDIRTYLGGSLTENAIANYYGGSYSDKHDGQYVGYSKEFTNIYTPENWTATNNVTLTQDGIYYDVFDEDVFEELRGVKSEILTGSQEEIDWDNMTQYPFYYYIATRAVKVSSSQAYWGGSASVGGTICSMEMTCSTGEEPEETIPITYRPVVVVPQTVTDGDFAVSENTELPEWNDPLGIDQYM